jgi:hypothetical protein
MPTSSGPNTSGESSLAFAYDVADAKNSYIGEPTTNLANFNIASSGFGSDTSGNLTQTANSSEATYRGRLSRKMVVGAGYWNAYVFDYNTGVSSAVFAVSYKVKTADGSHPNTIIGGGYIYGSAGSFFPAPTFTYLSDGWYLATMLYSGTSMVLNSLTGMNGSGGPKTFYIIDYQAEAKDHSTPFAGVAGTRSNTQGLLDLTRNNTVNLSNASFNSSAQILFDGTDDRIAVGNLGTIGNSYSIECVFYSTSVQSYRNTYDMNYSTYNPNTGNVGPRLEQVSNGTFNWIWSGNTSNNGLYNYTTSTSISANTYYHTVFALSSGFVNTYKNGVLIDSNISSTQGYITSFGDVSIGRGFILDPSRYFAGIIPILKIYNRALSSFEVANNYRAYKSRFNLS